MGELRDVGPTAPAYQHVGVGQELHVSLGGGESLLWRGVLAHQLGTHLLLVELYHDPAGLFVHLGVGAIVEDGDVAVSLTPGVVLEGALGTWTHLEVALLASKTPYDLSVLSLYLVDTRGISGTEEQVAVGLYVYGVDVEVVVEIVRIIGRLDVGLLDSDVLQAMPLEDDLPDLDVHLLDDPFPDHAILRAANRGEVRSLRSVGHQERGVLRGDEELVEVPTVTVARAHSGYLTVRAIEDHILADAVPGRDLALPPSEHGPAFVVLHLEVPCGSVPAKPHELPLVIDNHWTVLAGSFLQGGEDVARSGVFVLLHCCHLDGGRTQVGTREEGPHALFRRG